MDSLQLWVLMLVVSLGFGISFGSIMIRILDKKFKQQKVKSVDRSES